MGRGDGEAEICLDRDCVSGGNDTFALVDLRPSLVVPIAMIVL